MLRNRRKDRASQRRTTPSKPPEATRRPSTLSATVHTPPACPSRTPRHEPLDTSHSRTVVSNPALARTRASPLRARPQMGPVWPWNVARGLARAEKRGDVPVEHLADGVADHAQRQPVPAIECGKSLPGSRVSAQLLVAQQDSTFRRGDATQVERAHRSRRVAPDFVELRQHTDRITQPL